MKTKLFAVSILLIAAACASGTLGKRVKEPFTGSAYESNNRFFRASGKGESSQDNIARGKADIDAKAQLAGQVNTTMKQVADQYLGQTENEAAADVAAQQGGIGVHAAGVNVVQQEVLELRTFAQQAGECAVA